MDKQASRHASVPACVAMCLLLGTGALWCIGVNLYQFKHGQLPEPLSWIPVCVGIFTGYVLLSVAVRFGKSAWERRHRHPAGG